MKIYLFDQIYGLNCLTLYMFSISKENLKMKIGRKKFRKKNLSKKLVNRIRVCKNIIEPNV